MWWDLLKKSAETQTCTGDARIFSPALYYLSYLGIKLFFQLIDDLGIDLLGSADAGKNAVAGLDTDLGRGQIDRDQSHGHRGAVDAGDHLSAVAIVFLNVTHDGHHALGSVPDLFLALGGDPFKSVTADGITADSAGGSPQEKGGAAGQGKNHDHSEHTVREPRSQLKHTHISYTKNIRGIENFIKEFSPYRVFYRDWLSWNAN